MVLQVVDIISTWRTLGPELSCDSRPLMVKAIAELLALVPQLAVKSVDYEVHETCLLCDPPPELCLCGRCVKMQTSIHVQSGSVEGYKHFQSLY